MYRSVTHLLASKLAFHYVSVLHPEVMFIHISRLSLFHIGR